MTDHSNEVEEIKAQSWNECIVPRLEIIKAWFKHPAWEEGIGAYLTFQHKTLQKLLNKGCVSQRDEDKLRGRILMLEELLDLPSTISNNIAVAENEKKRPKPSGTAGY